MIKWRLLGVPTRYHHNRLERLLVNKIPIWNDVYSVAIHMSHGHHRPVVYPSDVLSVAHRTKMPNGKSLDATVSWSSSCRTTNTHLSTQKTMCTHRMNQKHEEKKKTSGGRLRKRRWLEIPSAPHVSILTYGEKERQTTFSVSSQVELAIDSFSHPSSYLSTTLHPLTQCESVQIDRPDQKWGPYFENP